jgi:hypothetical protein
MPDTRVQTAETPLAALEFLKGMAGIFHARSNWDKLTEVGRSYGHVL